MKKERKSQSIIKSGENVEIFRLLLAKKKKAKLTRRIKSASGDVMRQHEMNRDKMQICSEFHFKAGNKRQFSSTSIWMAGAAHEEGKAVINQYT